MNTLPFIYGLSAVASVAAVVLLYIFILPQDKREKLPKFVQIVHDIFNFKELYLEKILRVLYVFATVSCVITGALMIFGFSYYDGIFSSGRLTWYGGYGILLMIVGPIVTRLVFEGIMMFVLLVKNTIQINNKLKSGEEKKDDTVTADISEETV